MLQYKYEAFVCHIIRSTWTWYKHQVLVPLWYIASSQVPTAHTPLRAVCTFVLVHTVPSNWPTVVTYYKQVCKEAWRSPNRAEDSVDCRSCHVSVLCTGTRYRYCTRSIDTVSTGLEVREKSFSLHWINQLLIRCTNITHTQSRGFLTTILHRWPSDPCAAVGCVQSTEESSS